MSKQDKQRILEVMGRLDKTLNTPLNEVFGWSAQEKETKANQQQINNAKAEIAKYPPTHLWSQPGKGANDRDKKELMTTRINMAKQAMPTLANLIPQLFDLNQSFTGANQLYNGKALYGLIPTNWYYFVRGQNDFIDNEQAVQKLNQELDAMGEKMGLKEEPVLNEGRPFEPISLIRKAMTSKLISPDEYFANPQQMEAVAEETADHFTVPDGHGFGSSDMTAALKSFLDGMGYQTDYVDGRLTRLDKPEMNEEDDWIQKAVDPAHKGYCTPMTKDTCTPRRKALAKRFKAGIEDESVMEAFVGDNPEEYRVMVEKLKQSMDNLFQEQHFDVIDTLYRLIVERKRPLAPQIAETNENIHNTAQMGGILNSRGTAGYNPDAGMNKANPISIGHNIYKDVMSSIDNQTSDDVWAGGAENALKFYDKVIDGIRDAMYQDLGDSINPKAGAAPDEIQ